MEYPLPCGWTLPDPGCPYKGWSVGPDIEWPLVSFIYIDGSLGPNLSGPPDANVDCPFGFLGNNLLSKDIRDGRIKIMQQQGHF